MSKTLDDVVEELSAMRREMVTRSDFVEASAALRSELKVESAALRSEIKVELAALRSEIKVESAALRSEQEDLKEELLRSLAGIANQQMTFITLLTKLLNDREEADRRFAKLEAAVFGSKH